MQSGIEFWIWKTGRSTHCSLRTQSFIHFSMVSPDRKPELGDWRVGWGSWKLNEKLVEVERQVLSGC